MRILVTSSRMPHALDLIRKLGHEGHEVFASSRCFAMRNASSKPGTTRSISCARTIFSMSESHVFAYRHRLHAKRHRHTDLVAAQFYDIAWNGGELP